MAACFCDSNSRNYHISDSGKTEKQDKQSCSMELQGRFAFGNFPPSKKLFDAGNSNHGSALGQSQGY